MQKLKTKRMTAIFAVILILIMCFSVLTSCGEKNVNYEFEDLKFKLPLYFKKDEVEGADMAFYSGTANIYVKKADFEIFDGDSNWQGTFTTENYMRYFCRVAGFEYDTLKIKENKKRDSVTYEYYFNPKDGTSNMFCYCTVIRSDTAYYIITMSCEESMEQNLKPDFEYFDKSFKLK